MFLEILPDLLRGSTTNVCLIVLFFILSRPKYNHKLYIVCAIIITVIDTLICSAFYLNKNYTGVVYYSLCLYVMMVVVGKFFFFDKILQWCFNCVTMLNVYAIVVVASYILGMLFPHPQYAVTVIRIVMFAVTITLFRIYLRPLYLEVSENWAAFLLPTAAILANYLYIMLSLGDVEASMSVNHVYFIILTLVTVFTYLAIILSLKNIKQKYALREENLKRKAHEEMLTDEIENYDNFLNAAKQNRHDIRHHNAILAEYLNNDDIAGAKAYLKQYDNSIIGGALKEFAKDPTANAVFRLYDRRAREQNIDFDVHSETEAGFPALHTDTVILLSNIFENALEACRQCSFTPKQICYSSTIKNGSVLIEIKNSVGSQLHFENGLPVTTKNGGGTGLLSVKNIVEKYNGMLEVGQEGNEFYTRIIFPYL